jgi:hypothetical protein
MSKHLLVASLLWVWAVAGPANAQPVSMNMSNPQFLLLMNKAVQRELKLTEEQVKKIHAKIQELTPDGSPIMLGGEGKGGEGGSNIKIVVGAPKGGGAVPPGGVVQFDPSTFRMPDFKKIDEEILKLLDPPQGDRLKQLNLQRQGMTALAQDKVAGEVGLHEEQRELLKHILEENRKKSMDLVMKLRGEGAISP